MTETMLPPMELTVLIVAAVFSPLLALPLMVGSHAVTQYHSRRVIAWWFVALALLCSVPADAALLALLLGFL